MKISRLRKKPLILTIMFLAMITMARGMILGNVFPVVGMFLGALCCLISYRQGFDSRLKIFIVCCVFWGYCSVQGILFNSNSRSYLIQIFFYWVFEAGAAFIIFQRRQYEHLICRTLIKLLALFAASYVISLLLSLVIGWDNIKILQLDYNYFYTAPVFFPFTISYGSGKVGGITIYRLLGIARESGIMQCLYTWGYFVANKYFTDNRRVKLLMIIGVVACMSTTGIVIFTAIFAINHLTKSIKKFFSWQTLGIIVIVLIAVYFLMSDSSFGLSFRLQNSFTDRQVAMAYGIENFIKHPLFGIGFFREHDGIQSDANLIASSGNIGIVGIILFITVYAVAFCHSKSKRLFVTSNASFLITAVIAQPLFISPLMYIFLFNDYSNKDVIVKKIAKKRRK